MKLYEKFSDSGFHTSVLTTFSLDIEAYENIVLSRLRSVGCRNNLLIADNRMLTHTLDSVVELSISAGQLYSIIGADTDRLFHTKIFLQFGRRKGRLILGSSNVTASGLAGNLEVVGLVECTDEPSPEQQLVLLAWEHVSKVVEAKQRTVRQQLAWMENRTPWLRNEITPTSPLELTDNTKASLLSSHASTSLMAQMLGLIDSTAVSRLVVISPYWDMKLKALSDLCGALAPKEAFACIDPEAAMFPGQAKSSVNKLSIRNIGSSAKGRFVHAKLFLVETVSFDHVFFGSANCTAAALGGTTFLGQNDEVLLYRRLPPGTIVHALSLAQVLQDSNSVNVTDLPKPELDDDIELEKLAKRNPGRFEKVFNTLIWHLPHGRTGTDFEAIRIANGLKAPLEGALGSPIKGEDGSLSFEMNGFEEHPRYAFVDFSDGNCSGPALITHFDAIKHEAREQKKGRIGRAAENLSQESEESFWMLEQMEILISASETEIEISSSRPGSPAVGRSTGTSEVVHRTLNYREFIADRKLKQTHSAQSQHTLLGSEAALVRECLNRILNVEHTSTHLGIEDNEELEKRLLDRGDDVSDAGDALEGGEDFSPSDTHRNSANASEEQKRKLSQKIQKKATTRSYFENSVDKFRRLIASRCQSESITTLDVLRLRALLHLLSAAGHSGQVRYFTEDYQSAAQLSEIQVIPTGDENCEWGTLVGRLLFQFFGGKYPAIEKLQIDVVYDQVPTDLMECWATCAWVGNAALSCEQLSPMARLSLQSLMLKLYNATGLLSEAANSPVFKLVFQQLSERFCQRLGISKDEIWNLHSERSKHSIP